MPIAILEHHFGDCGDLSAHDLADRLADLWAVVRSEAPWGGITSDADCIRKLNFRLSNALSVPPGDFRDPLGWSEFAEACGSLEQAPSQVLSWHFSNLYWHQLTRLRFATCWVYMNARRVQLNLPELGLRLDGLGRFLESLSGSGPPLFDGQTFYPNDYADEL